MNGERVVEVLCPSDYNHGLFLHPWCTVNIRWFSQGFYVDMNYISRMGLFLLISAIVSASIVLIIFLCMQLKRNISARTKSSVDHAPEYRNNLIRPLLVKRTTKDFHSDDDRQTPQEDLIQFVDEKGSIPIRSREEMLTAWMALRELIEFTYGGNQAEIRKKTCEGDYDEAMEMALSMGLEISRLYMDFSSLYRKDG